MDGIHKAIFLWGLVCLVGFGAYQFVSLAALPPMLFWSVLTIIGVVGMIKWVPAWTKNKVVHVWLIIGVGGMLYHWAFFTSALPAIISSAWVYWALLMAIGFVATGKLWKEKFWYYVGALNFLAFLGLFFMPQALVAYQAGLLAVVSGLTTMYNGWSSPARN